ncbi:AHH domain-containing protein [Xanthomonas sp. WCS2017Noco2-62]|uniref:AHH domain-containing protein n=1 Tax=unclassified Xanthomonas TaxID=2643310 RepID=UPI00288A419A|nr:AHH domain-containing protein [Xanthomonas sp. WCS2017Noco2-62]
MPNQFTHFRDHHIVEQNLLKTDPLLKELSQANLFEMHSARNLMYLPTDPDFASRLIITAHSGRHISEYKI